MEMTTGRTGHWALAHTPDTTTTTPEHRVPVQDRVENYIDCVLVILQKIM